MEINNEKVVDAIGHKGYYKISESGRVYEIRPNLDCGFDVVKEIAVKSPGKWKSDVDIVYLNKGRSDKNQSMWRIDSLLHDSFFPDRAGLRFNVNGDLHVNNITHLNKRRPVSRVRTDAIIVESIIANPKLSNEEIAKLCMVVPERVRQTRRKYNMLTEPQLKKLQRRLYIAQKIKGKYQLKDRELATKFGVHRGTIYDDIKAVIKKLKHEG